ncbi:MAG: ABC transporter permease [Desulfosudaceae bacterium]
MNSFTGYIGRRTIAYVDHLLNLIAFSQRLIIIMVKNPLRGRAVTRWGVVEQIYFTAVQALFIIIPVALLVGSMLLIWFAEYSAQIDLTKITILLIIREIGPVLTAIVVILRSATAVTVEIGYMQVLNEIDSLEMAGLDPLRLLAVPRFIGITTAILCLFIIFDLIAILGGYTILMLTTTIPMGNYLSAMAKALTASDIIVGLVKAVCFGAVISVVTLYHGFHVDKRITRIPQVTSAAAMECFFYCLVLNIFISALFYL